MNTFWRTFKVAAWLGWEMDSNWTEPWLFIVYSVVKPVAGAFILVLMYTVFAFLPGNRQDLSAFSYMYVGNSFFIFVGSVLFGTFQVIQSDREWYQTIRYVYMAPFRTTSISWAEPHPRSWLPPLRSSLLWCSASCS